jgi:hypothetical protein
MGAVLIVLRLLGLPACIIIGMLAFYMRACQRFATFPSPIASRLSAN